jgi:hypothetical protein
MHQHRSIHNNLIIDSFRLLLASFLALVNRDVPVENGEHEKQTRHRHTFDQKIQSTMGRIASEKLRKQGAEAVVN